MPGVRVNQRCGAQLSTGIVISLDGQLFWILLSLTFAEEIEVEYETAGAYRRDNFLDLSS
jgi:hypothetical protein